MQTLWNDIGLAVAGIGINLSQENCERMEYPGENSKYGVAGDLFTNYFNSDGGFLENDETICATPDNLRNTKTVIAVSGGLNKVAAITGALKSGVLTDIVVDELTAEKILEI